jgi:hypothetical protein
LEVKMTTVTLDMESPDDMKLLKAQWRFGSGWIPGEPNEGLVAQTPESPALLADYDDSDWEVVSDIVPSSINPALGSEDAPGLRKVRSTGLTFGWFRTRITLPERVGDMDVAGSGVWFETIVDDYGEVWVDAVPLTWEEQFTKGRPGVVTGIKVPTRSIVTESARPGAEHVISVLAINGPLGRPGGGIYLLAARLAFERG